MTTIYLIRHAEAEGNLHRRIHGWYNALVTENGLKQIEALRNRFADIHIDAVYSSDLYRTMTTARAVYQPKGLELQTDPELRELYMGDWEDLTWGGVRHEQGSELDRFNGNDPDWRAPNGESFHDVGRRVEGALKRIAHKHPGQTVAVFSHGLAIRQATANIKGIAPENWKDLHHSDNTAVTCLAWDGTKFLVVYEGDNSHLDESLSTFARQQWWRKDQKKSDDINLWFRPLDMEREEEIYLEARRDAWHVIHKDHPGFDGEGYLRDAREHLSRTPWGVSCAMSGDRIVGLLQMDPERYSQDNAGYIPFCYLVPDMRGKGLGAQLIGHAVAFYRPLGRDKLRLRCAPYNGHAQHVYSKLGFRKIGEEQGSRVPLEILEKYIGYER